MVQFPMGSTPSPKIMMSNIQSIQISSHGAELQSLIANEHEYLWQGDPIYWGRRAPILFPIVGRLANDTLRIDGREYTMKQHGFARDAEFIYCDGKYMLVEDGRYNYPYAYELSASYIAEGNTLNCNWEVKNRGDKDMYFQIGAHPAFQLPEYNASDEKHSYIQCYDVDNNIVSPLLFNSLDDGLRVPYGNPKALLNEQAILALTNTTFVNGAILIEANQVAKLALFDKQGHRVLTVTCPQADAFGIWAPNKPGCPFVCIEPWCGIADIIGFKGSINERDCIHNLASKETYYFMYSITIEE